MLELCSIASGSSGNCICVGSDNHHVLIDAGISGKRIENGLPAFLFSDYLSAEIKAHHDEYGPIWDSGYT